MKIKFCGAARSVTGSCHMVAFNKGKVLIDCGMRQGSDANTEYGAADFPFSPAEIDAVLVTHAHIDHTGLIPLLIKQGFKGKVYATDATVKLSSIMLPDSGHIQEQEAEYQTRKNMRAGKPAVEPMYTAQDAVQALKSFIPVKYEQEVDIIPGVKARFTDVGHLLGSAAIKLWISEDLETRTIAFSGDIGRDDRPIICDPKSIDNADYLVVEGTYGDRNHEISTDNAKRAELAKIFKASLIRGGNIVIPSFAVGRTQEMLYYIKQLIKDNAVPGLENVPVYIDSPLGISATKVYEECSEDYYDDETKLLAKSGSLLEFPNLRVAQTADESKLINDQRGTNIIISSSGMCDAGRIRHHLKHNLFRADSTIVFTGYQAVGTLGRALLDGAKKVKLFGEEVRVNATIERIEGFSGHAGRDEIIEWINSVKNKPSKIFLVHGEEDVLESLGRAVHSLGYDVEIPMLMEEFNITDRGIERAQAVVEPRMVKTLAEIRMEDMLKELSRLNALIESGKFAGEDGAIKANIMLADMKTFVDKWERLI